MIDQTNPERVAMLIRPPIRDPRIRMTEQPPSLRDTHPTGNILLEAMRVSHHSVVDWENGKEPMVGQYPAIIEFLGYEPWAVPSSLGDRLRAARRRRGWFIRRAAEAIEIDEGTFARWEAGVGQPFGKWCERAEGLAGSDTPRLQPAEPTGESVAAT